MKRMRSGEWWWGGALLLLCACRSDSPKKTAPQPEVVQADAVGLHDDGGYIGSTRCAECHEPTHASWHRSFHRTMTQRPSSGAVLGRFDGAALDEAGRYRAIRRGDRFFVTQPGADGGVVERKVELITGSHHMQVYWVRATQETLEAFAFAFLLPEQRWVPNEWTLLRPPAEQDASRGEAIEAVYTWNRVCVKCHAVDGAPGFDAEAGAVNTTVAELGIACEACHGPGREHAEAWKNRKPDPEHPLEGDPTILDPREGGAAAASQVCAQCHSISVFHDDAAWVAHGRDAPPPAPVSAWGRVVRHPLREHGTWTDALLDADPDFFSQRYWSDGEVRVSGREFNGQLESPCAVSKDFGCTSCHRMHESEVQVDGRVWSDGQLKEGAAEGVACGRCHQDIAADPTRHSKHSAAAGPTCLDCHMPRTTYGLLGAIRSHTVTSPSVDASLGTGRPLACNLCHLNQTLTWSAVALKRDFGVGCMSEGCAIDCSESSVEAGVPGCVPAIAEWLLAGDAGQRALAAWHLGWGPAEATASVPWGAVLLDGLVEGDPYPAVRLVAERARRVLGPSGPAPAWASVVRSRRDDREVRLAE
ncbi:MAG: multiheme c-type cytochrome [Nannocystales bacterium]